MCMYIYCNNKYVVYWEEEKGKEREEWGEKEDPGREENVFASPFDYLNSRL